MTDLIAPTAGDGKTVQVDDIQMYVDDHGQGAPVFLLHGGIMDHQSWGNQIPELAKHFRVISPDTRGHGRTSDSDKALTYQQFADDVVVLMHQLDIPKAHFVGFSDGGDTALLLGMQHPELVDRIVLIGTPYNTSNYPEGTTDHFGSITPDELYEMVGRDSHFGEVMAKAERLYPSAEAWNAFWGKLVNGLWSREPNFELRQLADVTAPTLVLHAENEHFYGREHSVDMAETLPNGTLGDIPDATHTSPQENPAAVNAAILNFLGAS